MSDLRALEAARELGEVEGRRLPVQREGWTFDAVDFLLYAMLTDAVYMPELLWEDAQNREYGGCYRVRDYQYQLNRLPKGYAAVACARAVGKTQSAKAHAQAHAFDGEAIDEDMIISAPEIIHLNGLVRPLERTIETTRLTREMLKTTNSKTGFTHRPFGVDYKDGTRIDGRIPHRDGKGVKSAHGPKVIVDEGQDYPERGWDNINEVVNYDAVDHNGDPRWSFWIFGVHSGDRTSGFAKRASASHYHKVRVTQLMRPDWNAERKANAKAAYGGTSSPDYRMNILGESGGQSSPWFNIARLMSCVDQKIPDGAQPGSEYNEREYVHQLFRWEEFNEVGQVISDVMDLPEGYESVYGGVDIGLNKSPTVISLFTETKVGRSLRLKLFRRWTLERFRPKDIRKALYAIDWHFGGSLLGLGIDSTGLGLPIFQDMEDDEICPPHLLQVARGYFFNSKVPVYVAPEHVFLDKDTGVLRDQFGTAVKEEILPNNDKRFITQVPFIIASTRYLAKWVDGGGLWLPYDEEVIKDMLGETKTRTDAVARAAERGGARQKPNNMFHILDSFRAFAMAYHASEIEEQLAVPQQRPVMDVAM